MKERTLEAIEMAENYFNSVIEDEAHEKPSTTRTEKLHWAIEGLEGIAFIKYKQWKKSLPMIHSAMIPKA